MHKNQTLEYPAWNWHFYCYHVFKKLEDQPSIKYVPTADVHWRYHAADGID